MSRLACHGVAGRLAAARRRAGLSQRTLAGAADVAQPTVLRIEKGLAVPMLDTLERIARALRVSACWLAYGAGQMEAGADERRVAGLEERLGVAEQGLLSATTALCDALGIEMTTERRALLAGLGVEQLAALIGRLRTEGVWPQSAPSELAPTIH